MRGVAVAWEKTLLKKHIFPEHHLSVYHYVHYKTIKIFILRNIIFVRRQLQCQNIFLKELFRTMSDGEISKTFFQTLSSV